MIINIEKVYLNCKPVISEIQTTLDYYIHTKKGCDDYYLKINYRNNALVK